MSGSTGRCTRCPTRRRRGCRRGAGPGLPDQAAAGGRAGPGGPAGRHRPFRAVVADCFYGDNPGFTEALVAAKVPVRAGPEARRKGIWAPAEAAHTPIEAAAGSCAGRPRQTGDWTADRAALPRRPRRDLVGGRRYPRPASGPTSGCGWWWPPPTPATLPAADHLVSADQPAPPRLAPPPPGRPGRGGAAVRAAQLGRAGLQAGQARARLGRLPGPLRSGHPSPLGAGLLRVLVLWQSFPARSPTPP